MIYPRTRREVQLCDIITDANVSLLTVSVSSVLNTQQMLKTLGSLRANMLNHVRQLFYNWLVHSKPIYSTEQQLYSKSDFNKRTFVHQNWSSILYHRYIN